MKAKILDKKTRFLVKPRFLIKSQHANIYCKKPRSGEKPRNGKTGFNVCFASELGSTEQKLHINSRETSNIMVSIIFTEQPAAGIMVSFEMSISDENF